MVKHEEDKGFTKSISVYVTGVKSGKCTKIVDVVPLGYASLHLGFSPDFGYWGEKKKFIFG